MLFFELFKLEEFLSFPSKIARGTAVQHYTVSSIVLLEITKLKYECFMYSSLFGISSQNFIATLDESMVRKLAIRGLRRGVAWTTSIPYLSCRMISTRKIVQMHLRMIKRPLIQNHSLTHQQVFLLLIGVFVVFVAQCLKQ